MVVVSTLVVQQLLEEEQDSWLLDPLTTLHFVPLRVSLLAYLSFWRPNPLSFPAV